MEAPASILFSTNSLTAVANVNTTCPEQILWTDPLSIAFIDPASIGALQSNCINKISGISKNILRISFLSKHIPSTTKVVSSNPVHGEVYSIQHYVIKFISDLQQVSDFLQIRWFPPPIKLSDRHDIITEILLNVALNTINLNLHKSLNCLLFGLH